MKTIIGDLHNHSTASDGEYSPTELISLYAKKNIKYVALTDHDTLNGLPEAIQAGKKFGVNVIPGIEITIRFTRDFFIGSLHLLVYFSETLLSNDDFIHTLTSIVSKGRGISLTKNRIKSINSHFGPNSKDPVLERTLSFEEISQYSSNISRRHFAQALKNDHRIDDRSIISRIIGNDSPAYIPSGIDMSELKPFIKKYNTLKILAHPAAGSFPGDSHYKEVLPPFEIVERLLPEFMDKEICGLDGLEVFYPGHTEDLQNMLLSIIDRNHLIATGGSDCHDDHNRPIGTNGLTQRYMDIFLNKLEGTL